MLSSSKPEDVSQSSFVFKLADRQIERQLELQLQLQVPLHYTTTTMTSTNIPVVPHKAVAEVSKIGNL